jgi:hypothetical protein
MWATQSQHAELALVVAEQHHIFAEQTTPQRPALEFAGEPDGMPIAPHHFAAGCVRADLSDQFIFSYAERHNPSPELLNRHTGVGR